ncbi:hypothetical protein AB1Y20_013095 [Prymnesium parvum]|uniref:Uncharacterized protein n=1 Tax=Prymnesium parvum TaxID=97485 RepID=A0AB34IKP0_PRYPA
MARAVALLLALPSLAHGFRSVRAAPPRMNSLESLFSDKPPPSWGSPEWKWGSADGEAHRVAMRVRGELDKPHRRSAFVSYAKMAAIDVVDLKMALALKCQRARNLGYDAEDGRWESLMEEMAASEFEHEGLIDVTKLASAVNKRLATPQKPEMVTEKPTAVIAEALVELQFFEKGL